jgi:hypothetical protein
MLLTMYSESIANPETGSMVVAKIAIALKDPAAAVKTRYGLLANDE